MEMLNCKDRVEICSKPLCYLICYLLFAGHLGNHDLLCFGKCNKGEEIAALTKVLDT